MPSSRRSARSCQFQEWRLVTEAGSPIRGREFRNRARGFRFGESYNGRKRIGENIPNPTSQSQLSFHRFWNAVPVKPRCPKSAPNLESCVSRFEPSCLSGSGLSARRKWNSRPPHPTSKASKFRVSRTVVPKFLSPRSEVPFRKKRGSKFQQVGHPLSGARRRKLGPECPCALPSGTSLR